MRRLSLLVLLTLVGLVWNGTRGVPRLAERPLSPRGTQGDLSTSRWPSRVPSPASARHARPAPAPAAPDWLASAEREIARREYQASTNDQGLQAPNRANGFRTYFESTGVRLVERTAHPAELLAMRLERTGRGERLASAAAGTVSARGTRVEIRRDDLLEWYENSPRGLEQGFTLATRPAGEGPVVLEVAVTGALVRATADAAAFKTHGGRHLRYAGLVACDAEGRALPARLASDGDRLRICVDDAGATYPVTIDPILTQSAEALLTVPQANSNFGLELANGGDVNGDGYEDLLVSAYTYDSGQVDEGAVFLYLGSATGIANGAAYSSMFESDQAGALMGYGIAAADVNGDGYSDLLLGAYGVSSGQLGEGIVAVYMGGPSGISSGTLFNAAVLLQANVAHASFGQSVANAGDVNGDGYEDVLVGSPDANGLGAAYVFLGSASGVSTAPATTLSGVVANNTNFGGWVAGAGDINADGYDDICVSDAQYHNGQTNEGGLFTWLGSVTGIANGSSASAQSILESNQTNYYLGYKAIAAAGDVNGDGYADVIVGCLNWTNGEGSEGAAFILRGTAAGFPTGSVATAAMSTLEMNSASAGVARVAGAGDVNGDGYADVVVGSPGYDFNGTNSGIAAVYLGGPSGVASVGPSSSFSFIHPSVAGDGFGVGLAMGDWNGDGYADIAVGANSYDGLQTNEGAAYVYLGGSRGIVSQSETGAATIRQGEQANARFGVVAGAGDVNGDGYSDLIVGAPYYDAGETDEGAAFVYLGSSAGITSGAAASGGTLLQGNQANGYFGYAVTSAGDVNEDGYADVLVGAPYYDAGEADEGAAFVFLGGASGVANGSPGTAAATLQSNQASAHFGYAVAGIGDANGDGHVDVAVGAPEYDSKGAVFVFHGTGSGIANGDPSNAARSLSSVWPGGRFGYAVAAAGDVDGDGYADLLVGEPSTGGSFTEGGGAYVYQGSASGVQSFAHTQIFAQQSNANLGSSVASAGDVNGDGYDDIIVGAWSSGSTDAGAAYVFHGSALGVPSATPGAANAGFSGSTANAYMGAAVAGIGDADGDGYADIAIGSWNANSQGNVLVYRGSATGIVTSNAMAILVTGQNFAALGDYVAGVGDVNGDGFADLAAGASSWDSGQTDEGGAFIWKGGGNLQTRPSLARQRRGDGSGIAVQPWSPAHSTSGFNADVNAVDPAGRGREKIEVETCPEGKAFGSPQCTRQVSSTWTDAGLGVGNPGVALATNAPVAGAGLYNWRVRTLHAPFTVTQPGITARPKPAHGPWRRHQARATNGDVRVDAVVLSVERPGTSTDFAIAPLGNPARGNIVLSATLSNTEPAEVALFDVAGRQLVTRSIAGSPGRQSLTLARGGELPAGIYLVRLTQGTRAATTHVVLVR